MNTFITLEGIDGSGKTTAAEFLKKLFPGALFTREPGGTPAAEAIRTIAKTHPLSNYARLHLMLAARDDHLNNVILPALQHRTVICDRYIDSTYAYQGYKDMQHREPDVTLLFDVPADLARPTRNDALDQQDQTIARARYLQLASIHQHRIRVIDASKSIEDVRNQICRSLRSHIT